MRRASKAAAWARGIVPIIPVRKATVRSSKDLPTLYKGRARMEQEIGKLKRLKRIVVRCEKIAANYS